MNTLQTVLVVVAHPDDEVLGCGAAIARLSMEGNAVYIAILGEGVTSRYNNSSETNKAELEILHSSSRKVANLLGARDLFMFNLPDNQFDTIPLLDVAKKVEGLVAKLNPSVIYTHWAGDLNVDHVITHRAVMIATRPTPGQPVREVYGFEVLSSTEWAFGQFQGAFNPNVFIDVQSTLEKKISAMEVYEGEARPFPHPRSLEVLRSLAVMRGSQVGLQMAEAFASIRIIK